MAQKQLGEFGEKIASRYLENKGYKILAKNYSKIWDSLRKGEIDIIVQKDRIICFVEVKTLRQVQSTPFRAAQSNKIAPPSRRGYLPEDKVNFTKQKKLIKLAQSWLLENKIPLDSKWQIDVISVNIDLNSKKAKIRHLKNIISY